tara:strand:+ start:23784 stop:24149 length:366 start_codon:yes stop_codon:yes gene_type:complete
MKIMIVDDHQGIRLVLKKHLELAISDQYEVIECESGEEAVKEYMLHDPNCVLMDFELIQMNGYQASEIILRQDPKAKIIMVTSHDILSMRKKAAKLPIVDFVSKENLSELAPILNTLLNKK